MAADAALWCVAPWNTFSRVSLPADSYDALRRSIERALRADLPQTPVAELAHAIDQSLLEEARTGELMLAYLRLLAVGTYLAVVVWTAASSARLEPLGNPVGAAGIGIVWGMGAAGLLLALRRGWYRFWLRHAVPAADAAMIWVTFVLIWTGSGKDWAQAATAALSYVTALCAFLAVSGVVRLSRSSAQLSTILAVAVFAFAAAAADLDPLPGVVATVTLAATGALSVTASGRVRRVVINQVGRMALSRMYDDARRAIDAREEVLKVVSHDLRNPLNTISMSADLMLEVALSEQTRVKQLSIIKRAGERMNRLIQDLLDVTKLEAGRLGIAPRPIAPAAVIHEAVEMLRPLAAEKGIRMESVVADDLPVIAADAGRVLQVLSNLVGNAIKFTPAGGSVTLRVARAGGDVRFCVADTGSGISPEQLPRIFGRFWQADPTDRRGIGLGLAIAKGIVEAHGGRIWVESRVGEGTSFYFTLADAARGSD